MWVKYPNGKFGGPLKPSTNPRNPNNLDKLAALVETAKSRYEEMKRERNKEKESCMS